ncbi:MAG: hypothetical protein C0605_04680 [Hyphomicrobiales bacterium]|nr:MAG: hypothetical protein C0605_04680 [Hyphomicrobiales bacterium]
MTPAAQRAVKSAQACRRRLIPAGAALMLLAGTPAAAFWSGPCVSFGPSGMAFHPPFAGPVFGGPGYGGPGPAWPPYPLYGSAPLTPPAFAPPPAAMSLAPHPAASKAEPGRPNR